MKLIIIDYDELTKHAIAEQIISKNNVPSMMLDDMTKEKKNPVEYKISQHVFSKVKNIIKEQG